jgi:predicted negative regulator of RcsB-dependent stress response
MRRNNGFGIVEAIMILGVLVLLAGVGYVGWKALTKSESTQNTSVSPKQSAQVITTKADLEAAEKALSELDFDDSEGASAESQASL